MTKKLALVGAGSWGKNYIKTISNSGDTAKLKVLVSSNPASKELVSPECIVVSDWRELTGEYGKIIDGVIIAVPPFLHREIAVPLLEHKIPIMIEKPFALTCKEALEIADASQTSGVPILIDHIYLFHPAYCTLKQEVKKLGKVLKIASCGWNDGPYRKSVSPLWDWAPHDVSMCLDLIGDIPRTVKAQMLESKEVIPEKQGLMAEIELTFKEGCSAHITVGNMRLPKTRIFIVQCEQGTIIFDNLAENKLVLEKDGEKKALTVPPGMPLSNALQVFAGALNGISDYRIGPELAVDIVGVIEQAERCIL